MSAQADGGNLPRSGCFDLFTPLRSYAIPLCCPVERVVIPDMSCHMERRGVAAMLWEKGLKAH